MFYRWQVVATYINTHSSGKTRTSKECLARAKNFKESDLKAEVNEKAFEKFQEKHSVVHNKATPSDGNISERHGIGLRHVSYNCSLLTRSLSGCNSEFGCLLVC